MVGPTSGDTDSTGGLPTRAMIVAPSADRAHVLAADFDDVEVATPDSMSGSHPCVVIAGVPTADGSLRRVVEHVLADDTPDLIVAIDITDPIGLQLVHLDSSPLAGLRLLRIGSIADVSFAVFTRGDPGIAPDLAELRDPVGTWTARHRAFGEAERLAADLNDRALRRRIAALEGQLAGQNPSASTVPAVKPSPTTVNPSVAAARATKVRLAAVGGVVIVAVGIALALLTGTGYVGGLLTVGTLLGAVIALYLVRAQRRIVRRLVRIDSNMRKLDTDVTQQLKTLTGLIRSGPPHIATIERHIEVVGASAVDISRTLRNLVSGLHLPEFETRRHNVRTALHHQTQAVANLFSMLPVDAIVPMMGGWAASADVVVALVDELLTRQPQLVLECGSGVSTLWLALAIRKFGLDSRIVCLEHDADFADQTRALLERHGVDHLVEVRHAPLGDAGLEGHHTDWYDRSALEDLAGIGLLFVDGPPEATGPNVRYPAVPLLRDKFASEVTIVLDDLVHPMEQEITSAWQAELPEYSLVRLPLENGASVFRR